MATIKPGCAGGPRPGLIIRRSNRYHPPMCGRFTLHHPWSEIQALYNLTRQDDKARNVPARYNIAPTQDVLTVADIDGERRLFEARWWLVPHWAKELPKYSLFNARSEDAEKKPAFREAFKSHRCLIPADGFYEWTTSADDGKKDPWYITLPDGAPFAFAGLWAHNTHLDITSCTILTAAADPAIEHLHDRMPVILNSECHDAWLDPETGVPEAKALLPDNRGGELAGRRVGRAVNSSRRQGPELLRDPG